MNGLFVTFLFLLALLSTPSYAGVAEARDVARLNNCAPKKVEIFQQKLGDTLQTIYRVSCIEPKVVDDKAPKSASAMLVRCDGSLCEMLRAVDSSSP